MGMKIVTEEQVRHTSHQQMMEREMQGDNRHR